MMTEERLKEIEKEMAECDGEVRYRDVKELIAEVRTMREDNQSLRELLEECKNFINTPIGFWGEEDAHKLIRSLSVDIDACLEKK